MKFVWDSAAQRSFEKLKEVLTKAPVFAILEENVQFKLFTDTSSVGLGAMLARKGKAIAYASRILNSAERNYAISERECLAVIWA